MRHLILVALLVVISGCTDMSRDAYQRVYQTTHNASKEQAYNECLFKGQDFKTQQRSSIEAEMRFPEFFDACMKAKGYAR